MREISRANWVAGVRQYKPSVFFVVILVGIGVALSFLGWFCSESGYHFYWAEGLTERQVTRMYGEPEWREKGVHDGAVYLRYYTGFLNFVDLKVRNGRVIQVDIRPDD